MVLEGKYEVIRRIGEGGMGEVYEGRHRVIGRRVAVKFLRGEYARDPEVALRFENEARVAGGSEHENIAGVYDVGALADGTRYLVMEFIDGEDVDKLVQREAPLSVARSVFIVIQACRALDVVHQRGIVHRDLKPANLFLARRADKTDLVKVLDFGIAKLKPADGQPGTKTGTGDCRVFGCDTREFDETQISERLRVGFAFADGKLFNQFTLAENIALPLRYHRCLTGRPRRRARWKGCWNCWSWRRLPI